MVRRGFAEWPTLALLFSCYAAWLVAVLWVAASLPGLAIALVAISTALHSSLTHEAVHGHPTGSDRINRLLVWPALGLLVPYERFRDTHLAHHTDARLTDPYDDPESNYLDPAVWSRLPRAVRGLLTLNNTLLGRILLGPAIGQAAFMASDWRAIRQGDHAVAAAWRRHLLPLACVLCVVALAPMPLWAYLLAIYAGHGILKIRTFLEHQAHVHSAARSVVIEDRGPLALLFLNNNFHLVHHMHPDVPWYRLPGLYFGRPERYLSRNMGYRFRSYADVFARHFLRAKDPVPHPLWRAAQPSRPPHVASETTTTPRPPRRAGRGHVVPVITTLAPATVAPATLAPATLAPATRAAAHPTRANLANAISREAAPDPAAPDHAPRTQTAAPLRAVGAGPRPTVPLAEAVARQP